MTSRRTFLQVLGAGLVTPFALPAEARQVPAAGIAPGAGTAPAAKAVQLFTGLGGVLGLQLYSLRTQMEKDVPGTLKMVRDWGLSEVETAGYYGRTAAAFAEELKRADLRGDLLAAVLMKPHSLELLQTYLAAEQIFNGYAHKSIWDQGSTGAELVEALLQDESKPVELREIARYRLSTRKAVRLNQTRASECSDCRIRRWRRRRSAPHPPAVACRNEMHSTSAGPGWRSRSCRE